VGSLKVVGQVGLGGRAWVEVDVVLAEQADRSDVRCGVRVDRPEAVVQLEREIGLVVLEGDLAHRPARDAVHVHRVAFVDELSVGEDGGDGVARGGPEATTDIADDDRDERGHAHQSAELAPAAGSQVEAHPTGLPAASVASVQGWPVSVPG
jgi:hypothetical protein